MKAMREIGHQDVPWVHTQWGSREVDVRARDELLARLFKEISTGKTSGGVLGQFARFCVVGTSNTVIDFGVLNAALAAFPTRATVPLLAYDGSRVVGQQRHGRPCGEGGQLRVEHTEVDDGVARPDHAEAGELPQHPATGLARAYLLK